MCGKTRAYGIVCGAVSRLIVLDFDHLPQYERFCDGFPHLLHTLTVRTGGRGGIHLYYEVDFSVRSARIAGGDLIAEGKYVVGPGSVIGGRCWQVISAAETPLTLTRPQLDAVLREFAPASTAPSAPRVRPASGDYAEAYRRRVQSTGQRNNSLFRVALMMRDSGQPLQTAIDTLADLHAVPAEGEAVESRRREAEATLRSAYRVRSTAIQREGESRLPNTVREKLLQTEGGVAFLRVVEALSLSGVTPGTTLCIEEAVRLLSGAVGRHSVVQAFALPSPHTPHTQVDSSCVLDSLKNALDSKVTNALLGGKNRRYFTMPSPEALCEWLNVPLSPGDPVTLDDVKSVRAYRAALHNHLIKRRPGVYSRGWQAARLGTTPRTVRAYTRELGHHVIPRYTHRPITRATLDHVPSRCDGLEIDGQFLEDETGKRYKPYREIAARLLKQGRRLALRHQLPGYHYEGDTPPFYQGDPDALPADASQRLAFLTEYLYCLENDLPLPQYPASPQPVSLFAQPTPSADLPTPAAPEPEHPPPSIVLPPPAAAERPRKYLKPLPNHDDEGIADIIQMMFPQLRLSTTRWIVVSLGRTEAYKLACQTSAMRGRIRDVKEYLLGCVRRRLRGQGIPPQPRSLSRPFRDPDQERAAQRLYKEVPTLRLQNARQLVALYGTTATHQTLDHMRYLEARPTPYPIQNRAGFFLYSVRAAWRKLNGSDFTIPTPRFRPESHHQPYDPKKAFLRVARSGKTINWAYLDWRTAFFYEQGIPDPFADLIASWRTLPF
jgi:hypothetical protein